MSRLNYKNLLVETERRVEGSTSEADKEYFESVLKFLLSPRGVILGRARAEEERIKKVKKNKTKNSLRDILNKIEIDFGVSVNKLRRSLEEDTNGS